LLEAVALRTESLCKLYRSRSGGARGLAPLSLEVASGEAVALCGPNGSGKTTALRVVSTLVEPTSGRAAVFGHDVVRRALLVRSAIGVVLASTRSFYWRLSARHNLMFFASTQGVRPGVADERIARLVDELEIDPQVMRTAARRLSRGTLARLSLARALLHAPRLLLLDEPLSAVDRPSRDLVWRVLDRRRRLGLALLAATHDPSVVERCDRAVSIRPPA